MITTLSPAQWAELALFRDEAYQRGSACGPTTRELVQPILTEFYQRIGKDAPRFEWLASPLACLAAYQNHAMHSHASIPFLPQIGEQLRLALRDQLQAQLYSQCSAQLQDELHAQLGTPLWARLHTLGNQLWDGLQVMANVQLQSKLGHFFWGSHEKYWIAFYGFMPHIGVHYPRDAAHLLAQWDMLTDHCGWWLPCDHVCFVADRPIDAQYRSQNAHGPAMQFADGFAVWARNGVYEDPRQHSEERTSR